MSELGMLILKLVATNGIDLTMQLISTLGKVTTVDEAIAALQVAKSKTWQDYVNEAK